MQFMTDDKNLVSSFIFCLFARALPIPSMTSTNITATTTTAATRITTTPGLTEG